MTWLWLVCEGSVTLWLDIILYVPLCADIHSYYFIIILTIGQEVLYLHSANFRPSEVCLLNPITVSGADWFVILKLWKAVLIPQFILGEITVKFVL